eukprot:28062-Rhodomonas_salina.1
MLRSTAFCLKWLGRKQTTELPAWSIQGPNRAPNPTSMSSLDPGGFDAACRAPTTLDNRPSGTVRARKRQCTKRQTQASSWAARQTVAYASQAVRLGSVQLSQNRILVRFYYHRTEYRFGSAITGCGFGRTMEALAWFATSSLRFFSRTRCLIIACERGRAMALVPAQQEQEKQDDGTAGRAWTARHTHRRQRDRPEQHHAHSHATSNVLGRLQRKRHTEAQDMSTAQTDPSTTPPQAKHTGTRIW